MLHELEDRYARARDIILGEDTSPTLIDSGKHFLMAAEIFPGHPNLPALMTDFIIKAREFKETMNQAINALNNADLQLALSYVIKASQTCGHEMNIFRLCYELVYFFAAQRNQHVSHPPWVTLDYLQREAQSAFHLLDQYIAIYETAIRQDDGSEKPSKSTGMHDIHLTRTRTRTLRNEDDEITSV
jgi:hypothetical protein